MDKSWMLQYHNRFSQPYIDGVNSFIEFAKGTSGGSREIKCPCNYCCNGFKHDYETVRDHLLRRGMMVSYDTWLQHGELAQSDESDDSEDESNEDRDGYDELLEDHGRGTYMMDDTLGMDDVRNFEIMLEASQRGLYPGCKDSETLLAFVIRMLHVKEQYRWSNKSCDKVSRRKNGEGKRKPGEDDDNEEYRPPQGDFGLVSSDENTSDDGTSGSPANMVTHMNRGKRSRHACAVAAALAQATSAQPPVTRSSRAENTLEGAGQATPAQPQVTQFSHADSMPEMATIARVRSPTRIANSSGQPDQILTPPLASGEGSQRVRGKTRGLKVEKLRRQVGHAIPISIPASCLAPEGKFATSFANLLGVAIRDEAPVRKEGWKSVPEGIKKLVVKRVQRVFEFGDYVNDPIIKAAVDTKCQKLYRDWKCELHTHYLSLLDEGVPDPKSHPLKPCKADDWAWMIDNLWETMEWKEKSKKARVSRSKMPWNHTSGSRSFLARSSIIRAQNAGHAQPFPDFYHDTHYMNGKKKWINEEAQKTHEELVRVMAEQSQPSITSSMTDEQISVKVLGQRSGYLKGFGIRTKSTSGSTQNRTGPDSKVLQLQQQVAEFGKRTSFLEGLVLQLAERVGIDPSSLIGGVGTSSGAQDATSQGLNEN